MRVTQRSIALTSLQGLNRNQEAVGRLQQQLTSGRAINRPSDSPTGTNQAMQTRSEHAAVAQQARNIADGEGRLAAADTTLQSMLGMVRRVRDLTVQGSNTGAVSESTRAAIATEVAALREALLGQANQAHGGRPLFGGPTSSPTAYDPATGAWQGRDGAPVVRQVSETEAVRIDITGPEVFGNPQTGDLFAVVADIAQAAVADPAALGGHLERLDGAMGTMLTALGDVGARAKRLETAAQVNVDRGIALRSRLAEVEGVDLSKTIMELQMQKVGYEAALSATAKVLQPTLVDFLR